jgi:hypothetical protein
VRKVRGSLLEKIQRAKYVDVELALADWIDKQRGEGHSLSGEDLKIQALKIFESLNKDPLSSFVASNGWLYRFCKRHNFTERAATSVGQKIPPNAKGIA